MNRLPNTLLDNQNRKSPNKTTSIIQGRKMMRIFQTDRRSNTNRWNELADIDKSKFIGYILQYLHSIIILKSKSIKRLDIINKKYT